LVGMKSKIILFIVISIAVCSCSLLAPKRIYKYAEPPFDLNTIQEIKLDTAAFYYRKEEVYIVDKVKDTSFYCMKFYSNGCFQFRSFDTLPSISLFPNLSPDELEHYKIENGVLKLEVWRGPMAGFGYWEGKIYGDSIIFFQTNNLKRKEVFIKKR
jgi:hypothetical protein